MLSVQAALVALALGGGGETVLYDFYIDGCAPCRAMSPLVHQLAEEGYPVKQVNAGRQPELAERYGVDCYPTFVMVAEGREVARRSGQCGVADLRRMFDAVPDERQPRVRGQSPDRRPSDERPRGERMPAVSAADPLLAGGGPALRSAPPAGARPSSREAFLARLTSASVRLKIEDPDGFSYGTGTIIHAQGDEALILTCGHVFRDSRGKGRIAVDLFGPGAPQGIAGKLIGYDLDTDVALVRIRTTGRVEVVPVAPPDYRVGRDDPVVSVGCDHGDPPSPRESRVTDLNKFRGPANIQVAGQPVTGRSGGGLFAAEGLLIGVCNAADPADDEGLYAALPSVYAELDRAGLSRVYEETGATVVSAVRSGDVADATDVAAEPDMPSDMPKSIPRLRAVPVAASPRPEPRQYAEQGALSSEESSVIEELARHTGGAEVICIIRPADDEGSSEIIVLDRASPEFRELLAEARREAPRELPRTSLDVPTQEKSTAAARRARQPGRRASPWRPAWRNRSEVAQRTSAARR